MKPTSTYRVPLADVPAPSRQAALDELRAQAAPSKALRRRLARLGQLVAEGRPLRLDGHQARVQAAQQAVLAYAAKHPARVVLTAQEVLARLGASALDVSLHEPGGWPVCRYRLTRLPDGQIGRAHV